MRSFDETSVRQVVDQSSQGECHMSGEKRPFWKILAGIATVGLASLACKSVYQPYYQFIQQIDCEASGGHWKHDRVLNDDYCENAGPEYTQKYFPTSTPIASSTLDIPTTQVTSPSNSKSCDATQSLQVTSEITMQETNQYGTRICEYTLTISNTDEDTGIWVYFYQHDKDGYAHTEKSHWMGNILIEPGKDGSWPASIYIYDDKDADGPVMSIPERIAGVFNIPECAEEKQDSNFFELISIPIEAACPME